MQNAKLSKEWLVLIIIIILVVGIGIFEWKKNKALDTSDGGEATTSTPLRWSNQKATREEKEENNVTVTVEYLPDKSTSYLYFRTALDTHSVGLDSFDFVKDIILEKDGKSFFPTLLKQEGSGHHRSAEITFLTTNAPFTIVIKNLSNIPRREFYFEKL